MGRVRAHTSSSPSRIGMRWSLVLVCVLLVVGISEGKTKKKPGKKPSKPGKLGECDVGSPKLTKKNTKEYTDIGKCTCWWDITRHDCACCKKGVKGGTMQCGYPMHKFCWKKSDRGCPGVCNYKYTLSGKGYPCFSDHSNTDCACCKKKANVGKFGQYWQCECNKGWFGNGIQCMDSDGDLSASPDQEVEVTFTLGHAIYDHEPTEFGHGDAMEKLLN